MITSYTFSNSIWTLLNGAETVDKFYLPDTYIQTPAIGATAGVVLSEDNDKHELYISLAEIVAMGLTDIATFTAQFNSDKAASDVSSVPLSIRGGNATSPNVIIGNSPTGGDIEAGANNNILIGNYTGTYLSTGDGNVLMGANTGQSVTTGSYNIFIGQGVAKNDTVTGYGNVAIGKYSSISMTGGYNNTFTGTQSGRGVTTGSRNVISGYNAGYVIGFGSDNVMLGSYAGRYATGDTNVFLGMRSGFNATGSSNVFLGFEAGYNETGSYKLYISNSDTANPLIKGDFESGITTLNSTLVVAPQTATLASALTPVEGMMVNVSDTNGTFTSTGSWIYEGGSWKKNTVV